jgi:hypothetical protein
VGFVKLLPIETIEKAQIMGVQLVSLKRFDHGGDAGAFVTHALRLSVCHKNRSVYFIPVPEMELFHKPTQVKQLTDDKIATSGRIGRPIWGRGKKKIWLNGFCAETARLVTAPFQILFPHQRMRG